MIHRKTSKFACRATAITVPVIRKAAGKDYIVLAVKAPPPLKGRDVIVLSVLFG